MYLLFCGYSSKVYLEAKSASRKMRNKMNANFELQAGNHHDELSWVALRAIVPTVDDANAIKTLFPKSVKAVAGSISGSAEGKGFISIEAHLISNGVNGGVNETGVKRIKSALKVLANNGLAYEWVMPFANSVTEAEFLKAVN